MDATPKSTTTLSNKIRNALSHPSFRGRPIGVSEVCARIRVSRSFFYQNHGKLLLAQHWLELNSNGPTDTKVYYDHQLRSELQKLNPDIAVEIKGRRLNSTRQFTTKEVEVTRQVRITKTIPGSAQAKITTVSQQTEVTAATTLETVKQKIRELFVFAKLGDSPSLTAIIAEIGRSLQITLNETEIREAAITENWRGQRAAFLHRTFDLVPEEAKYISIQRRLRVEEMLYNHFKILSRQLIQYAQTGEVKSFDGAASVAPPDPSLLPAYAEAMRRIVDDSKPVQMVFNNQINNLNLQSTHGLSAEKYDHAIKRIARLETMSPEELMAESEKMEMMLEMLKAKPAMSLSQIEEENRRNSWTDMSQRAESLR